MLKSVLLIFFSFWAFGIYGQGQQDIEVGLEYLKAGEYEKAKSTFQKLSKNKDKLKFIHKPYLQTLNKLKDFEEAEKFLKKEIKYSEGEAKYEADLGRLYEMMQKPEEAKKQYDKSINKVKSEEPSVYELVKEYIENSQYDLAIQTFKVGREYQKSDTKFAFGLAKIFNAQGKKQEMIEEYLNYGLSENARDVVQNIFQDEIKDEKDADIFEKVLYAKVQKFPEESYFAEILTWHLIQKKEFYKAFVQARALDRRYRKEGVQVTDLGFLAHQNKDYTNSGKIFEYLVKEYPKHQNYPLWRRMMIQAKEEVIKDTYPINKSDIRVLITEYTKMLEDIGTNQKTLEAVKSKALLYAFYLNEKDTAIVVLESAIKLGQGDQQFVDKCKLDLGDIYLLKSEPWEATLLYSQVEKSSKDSPIGYDAKLRNAKLSYYRGEFDLAKEVLDILKQATTREIANDAMELSLLIQDNTGVDSTEKAMKEYSGIELLLFQNRVDEALTKLNQMEGKYNGNSIEDEVLFLRAKTYLKKGDTDAGVKDLEKIIQKFSIDILGDNALYLLAKTYQDKLNQPSKAMKLFQELLTKYPGSIYGADSRKRFRNLRGDAIN
jgi:tetratricopeptide (TPR) repeat protein